jgi:ribosomal protein S18 acetylase RimI-like enzyme
VSTVLRNATEGDLDFVTWVMLSASRSHLDRGIWEYMNDQNGDTTLAFLRRMAATETVHLFHRSLFLIAEVDGEPAAAMCGYDSDTQGFDVYGREMPAIAGASGVSLEDPEYARRGGVLMSGFVMDHVGPDGPRLVIENVATKPEFRRRGLVAALLDEWFARGRARGYETAQISVFLENTPARNAYLKAGFEPIAEQRSEQWSAEIGCPGTEQMLKAL